MTDDSRLTRRDFVRAGVMSSAALACTPVVPSVAGSTASQLRTALCAQFGIDYPIFQSGMAPVAGPELAAAVSNAGGLGILGLAGLAPDEVRARIRQVRELTNKPFGANLLLHSEVWPPVESSHFPDSVVASAQAVLNRFRARLGLPAASERPVTRPNLVPGAIDAIIEERVPVFSIGLGNPPRALVERFHAYGAKVVAMVCTIEDARTVALSGVDAVIAQGYEAGGHRSTWTKRSSPQYAAIGTLALVPQVKAAVSIPVIAAGGITTGAAIVAVLALGAAGALVGSRFVATTEARAPQFYKDALTHHDGDATVITDAFTGLYARVIRNAFTEEYGESRASVLTGYLQSSMDRDIVTAAGERGNSDYYPMWAGQGIGMIRSLPPASQVLGDLVREANTAFARLRSSLEA